MKKLKRILIDFDDYRVNWNRNDYNDATYRIRCINIKEDELGVSATFYNHALVVAVFNLKRTPIVSLIKLLDASTSSEKLHDIIEALSSSDPNTVDLMLLKLALDFKRVPKRSLIKSAHTFEYR